MSGENSFQPYSINTFSQKGKSFAVTYPIHHVSPHYVQSHFREGKFISSYWRDGDGNTNRDTYHGYYAKNPNAVPRISMITKRASHNEK
jgi:hypothetical protein